MKPSQRPLRPEFSSGPCAKPPGWTTAELENALLGRSHRTPQAVARLAEVIERSRNLLGVPADYRVGIVPGSDTGAFEMALWSMLGMHGAEVLAWESFGEGWSIDITAQLQVENSRIHRAEYGDLPDLGAVDFSRDVVFPWNGTTSGVCLSDGDWIPENREGLTFCDATSAVFAMPLDWEKLDVVTWSWQKVLGGEAAHGMLALSPRAVARLESEPPPRPLPKLFRLTKKGKLLEGIFRGETINTPSMLCVEDALSGLRWAEAQGGQAALIARCQANLDVVSDWVEVTPWAKFLAEDVAHRSCTSICIAISDAAFLSQDEAAQRTSLKKLVTLLSDEGVANDISGYRDAPPGLRIWGGATIETADLTALLPWIQWAWEQREAR